MRRSWARRFVLAAVLAAVLLALNPGPGGGARAATSPLWVDDLSYGSAGGGFYWDPGANQVWTAERGWHLYSPATPPASTTLWVNDLTYGSAGGGFYLDPRSGQVWTAERGWHSYDPHPPGARVLGPAPACYQQLAMARPAWRDTGSLVILIHGWTGDPTVMSALEAAVGGYLGPGNADWGVQNIDWSGPASLLASGGPLPDVGPARAVGACLGGDLAALGYRQLHIVAHSLGSWVADAIAATLARTGGPTVQVTLLDAYDGAQYQLTNKSGADLADAAARAEHYYHPATDAPFTQTPLRKGCNYDVGALGPDLPPFTAESLIADSHWFPIRWYVSTVLRGQPGEPGFPQSPEFRSGTRLPCSGPPRALAYAATLAADRADPRPGERVRLSANLNFDAAPTRGTVRIEIWDTTKQQRLARCDALPCTADATATAAESRQYRVLVVTARDGATIAQSPPLTVTWR